MRETLSASLLEIEPSPRHVSAWLAAFWPLVAGREIASISQVERLRSQTLHISVTGKEWFPALKALEKNMIQEINNRVGHTLVDRLVFKESSSLAPQSPQKPQQAFRKQRPAAGNASGAARGHLEAVKDNELRGLLQRLEEKFRFVCLALAFLPVCFLSGGAAAMALPAGPILADAQTVQEAPAGEKAVQDKAEAAGQKPGHQKTRTHDPRGEVYYHYLLAIQAERKWDFDTAIAHYQKVIEQDPGAEEFYLKLAHLYLRNGQLDSLAALCEKAMPLFPDNSSLPVLLAETLVIRGEKERALSYLQNVLKKGFDFKASLIVGQIFYQNKDFERAKKVFNNITAQKPTHSLGYHMLARAHAQTRQYPQMEENLNKALRLKPSFRDSRELLVWVLEKQGKYSEAAKENDALLRQTPENEKLREKAVDLKRKIERQEQAEGAPVPEETLEEPLPASANLHLKLGSIFFEKAEYAQAMEEFRLVLAEEDNRDVRLMIARIYEIFERYDQALDELKALQKLDPESVEVLLQMARVHNQNGQIERTIDTLLQAVKFKPDYDELYHSLSMAYMDTGENQKAIDYVEKAIALNDRKPAYFFERGLLLERVGKIDKALESMKKVLQLNPRHSHAHNFIGYLYALQGRGLDKALEHLQQALLAQPQNGYFLDSLGWIYFRRGNAERALVELQKAMVYALPDPVLYDHMGDVLFDLKRFSEAKKYWETSLTLTEEKINEDDGSELPNLEGLKGKIERVEKVLNPDF